MKKSDVSVNSKDTVQNNKNKLEDSTVTELTEFEISQYQVLLTVYAAFVDLLCICMGIFYLFSGANTMITYASPNASLIFR